MENQGDRDVSMAPVGPAVGSQPPIATSSPSACADRTMKFEGTCGARGDHGGPGNRGNTHPERFNPPTSALASTLKPWAIWRRATAHEMLLRRSRRVSSQPATDLTNRGSLTVAPGA